MNLQELKKEIPFKWRVQSATQYGANCVSYIDARDVQDLLDEVCNPLGWQCKYYEHKGNLFCSIGIYNKLTNEWVFKGDCGTESNVEKQKGEASDAFKRAAVMWGIGRFLYSMPLHKIKEVGKDKNNKYYPTHNGAKIWDVTKHINGLGKKTAAKAKKPAPKKPAAKLQALMPEGYLYLITDGTKADINKAFETRTLTKEQQKGLEDELKHKKS